MRHHQRISGYMIAVGVLTLIVQTVGCGKRDATPGQDAKAQQREKTATALTDLAKQYSASVDWLKTISPTSGDLTEPFWLSESDSPIYTIDVTRALVSNTPVAFLARLLDVEAVNDSYRLTFMYPDEWSASIIFILTMESARAIDLLRERASWEDTYAVVAQVVSVRRPLWRLSAFSEGPEEVFIEAEVSERPFYAAGRCVAAKLIALNRPAGDR